MGDLEFLTATYFRVACVKPSRSHRRNMAGGIARWIRAGCTPHAAAIGLETFAAFRAWGIEQRLSHITIEATIDYVLMLLRMAGPRSEKRPHGQGLIAEVPWHGSRLSRVKRPRPAAPLESLSAVYLVADQARIPSRKLRGAAFWKPYLVTAYNTGLRASDLLDRLLWSNYFPRIRRLNVTASKTGKQHEFFINDVLMRHLDSLPRIDDRMFPFNSRGQENIRRELKRLCDLAGVPHFLPHAIRRRAGTEFEKVHAGAGPLLLGHSLGSSQMTFDHYVDPYEVMQIAGSKVAQPAAFLESLG